MGLSGGGKIVTDGLVLYLDSSNTKSYVIGDTAINDITTNEHTGVLVGGVTFSSDNSGSLVFDGVDDCVDTSYFGSDTSSYTFGIWVKYTNTNEKAPLTRGRDGFGSGWSISLNISGGAGGYYFRAGAVTENGGLFAIENTIVPVIDNWYYLTGIWQYNVGISLYVNGVYITQSLQASTTLRTSTKGWTLASISSSYFDNCNISNVQIYDKVLTSDEILQNYNALKNRFGL